MLEWLLTAGNKNQSDGINVDPIAPALDMSDPIGYFAALNKLFEGNLNIMKKPAYFTSKNPKYRELGYGLIQEEQAIHKLNENAIVDKVTLSKGGSSGNPHETNVVFESEKVKKLYETDPQFKRKIDEIAKTMQGRTIYVKLDEYQHGRKITDNETKADNVTKKPPKKPDLWDELLKWLNKNKEEVAIILAIIVLLIALILR